MRQFVSRVAIAALIAVQSSCIPNVAATNPFDPEVPASLQAKATAQGLVTDAQGLPVAGALLSLSGATKPADQSSAADGSFSFGELTPDVYTLTVRHPAYLRQVFSFSTLPGEARALEVVLDTLPSVVTASSAHLRGVVHRSGELNLPTDVQDHSAIVVEVVGQGLRTVTNTSGAFDLYIGEGTYTLSLSASDYKTETVANVVAAPGTTTDVATSPIVLAANPGSISGVVALEGGGAAADVTAALEGGGSAPSSGSGAYLITDVAPGTYTLRLSKDGFATSVISSVGVRGGRATVVPDVTLQRARGGISGRVTLSDSAGSNAGAVVTLSNAGVATFTAISGDDGSFVFADVPVGDYTVTASKEQYASSASGVITVTEGNSVDLGTLALTKQQGDFVLEQAASFRNSRAVRVSTLIVPSGNSHCKFTGDLSSQGAPASTLTDSNLNGSIDAAEGVYIPCPAVLSGNATTWFALGLEALDGSKTVRVQFSSNGVDDDGPEFSASITLDETPPVLSAVSINGGAAFTASADITLTLTAQDATSGLDTAALSNQDADFSNSTPRPFASSVDDHDLDLALDDLGDACETSQCLRTVFAQVCDRAGNCSAAASDSITYDQTPPALANFRVNGQAAGATNSPLVTLSVQHTDATALRFAETDPAALDSAQWITVTTSPVSLPFALSAAAGLKTVYAQAKDAAGNLTPAAAVAQTITLDLTGPSPASVSIDGGAYALSTTVTVDVSTEAGASWALFTNPTFSGVPAATGTSSQNDVAVTLPLGDGEKYVYARFTDAAGNSSLASDSVLLDTTPPEVFVVIDYDASVSLDTDVALQLTASDDVVGMTVATASFDPTMPGQSCQTEAFSSSKSPVALVGGDGVSRGVFVCVRDAAGNKSALATDAIIVDTVAPGFSAAPTLTGRVLAPSATPPLVDCRAPGEAGCEDHATLSKFAQVSVAFTGSGAAAFAVGPATLSCAAAQYSAGASASGQSYVLTEGDGAQRLKVCLRDSNGNSAEAFTNFITVDTTPPDLMTFDSVSQGNRELDLSWRAPSTDAAGYFVAVRRALDPPGVFTKQAATSLHVDALDNCQPYLVSVAAYDAVGNYAFSPPQVATPTLEVPENALVDFAAVGAQGRIALTVASVSNADAYRVFFRRAGAAAFSSVDVALSDWVGGVGQRSYVFGDGPGEGVLPGTGYELQVAALDGTCASARSDVVSTNTFALGLIHESLGTSASARYGATLAAGDVDGDGFGDLLVGAPEETAFYPGNATPLDIEAFGIVSSVSGQHGQVRPFRLWQDANTATGSGTPYDGAAVGSALVVSQDLDGDGRDDLLIGAPDETAGGANGVVYIISGRTRVVLKRLVGPPGSTRFGASVAARGDVDDDGVLDIAVGAPGNGRVYIYEAPLSSADPATVVGPPSFGETLAGPVTINGVSGYAVGAPAGDGQVQLVTTTALLTVSPSVAGQSGRFGAALSVAVRGAESWLAVGEPSAAAAGANSGRVELVRFNSIGAPVVAERVSLPGTAGTAFGSAVAAGGTERNGDEASLLIGAPGLSAQERAFVFGLDVDASGADRVQLLYTIAAPRPGGGFGAAVAITDMNRDGRADFAVGAPNDHGLPGQNDAGRLYVFGSDALALQPFDPFILGGQSLSFTPRGGRPTYTLALGVGGSGSGTTIDGGFTLTSTYSPSGVGITQPLSLTDAEGRALTSSARVFQFTGYAAQPLDLTPPSSLSERGIEQLSFIGDINADGVADLVAAVSLENRIYVVSGRSGAKLNDFVGCSVPASAAPGVGFGSALSTLADMTGDGVPELVVGAPRVGPNENGAIYIIPGNELLNATPACTQVTPATSGDLQHFGSSIASLGQAWENGARADRWLAVGAPDFNSGLVQAGRFEVVQVTAGVGTLSANATGGVSNTAATASERFGASLAALDLDGDGYQEIAVGTPGFDGARGRISLYRIASPAKQLTRLMSIPGPADNSRFGLSLVSVPDSNGDGIPDLVSGNREYMSFGQDKFGIVHIVSGADGRLLSALQPPVAGLFGAALAHAGDIDRDGFPELLVGAPATQKCNGCIPSAGVGPGALYLYSLRDNALLWAETGEPNSDDQLGSAVAAGGYDIGFTPVAQPFARDGLPDFAFAGSGETPANSPRVRIVRTITR